MEALNIKPRDMLPSNPFYPVGTELVDYLANEWHVIPLLSLFVAGLTAIAVITRIITYYHNPTLSNFDKSAIGWNVFTGFIHIFFEGYFSLTNIKMSQSQHLFAQLWKEYALSDSRYLTGEAFVLTMETCTAFLWGPISFIVAWFITTNHPLRHPLQIVVTMGQMYGLVLYYMTSMYDYFWKGIEYSRPEPLYFWVYYFLTNFVWMVIPGYLLYTSVDACANAFRELKKSSKSKKSK